MTYLSKIEEARGIRTRFTGYKAENYTFVYLIDDRGVEDSLPYKFGFSLR
jgi:hypothetical protein